VGTTTEIYDYMRLLFARIGHTFSPISGKEVRKHTTEDVIQTMLSYGKGTKFAVLCPLKVPEGRSLREQLEMLKAVGGAEYAGVSIEDLLGSSYRESEKKLGKLHFSRVRPSENVCRTIEKAVQEGTTRPEEILDALTVMNTYTRIGDNGIVEHGSLRTARMFRKDLVLTADLLTEPLTEEEHTLLKDAVMALQHIGTMKSKGKGLVACTLKRTGGEDHA
jgi:hypothetical protein